MLHDLLNSDSFKNNLPKALAFMLTMAITPPLFAQEEMQAPEGLITRPQFNRQGSNSRNNMIKNLDRRNLRGISNRRMGRPQASRTLTDLQNGVNPNTADNQDNSTNTNSDNNNYSEKVAVNTPPANNVPSTAGSNSDEPTIDHAARMKNGKVNFDFNKTSIEDIVKTISDITQKNFIIPEKIKGQKLTILSPVKVSAYEAYQAFLSALEINNLTLVKSGKFYKITNSKDAVKAPIPTYFDDASNVPWNDSLVTILLPLKYVDAQNVSNLLKGMTSSDGTMTVFQPTNTIILSDYGNNIHRIKSILEKLDQEGGREEMQIIPVENGTASELAEKIKQLFDVDKKSNNSTPSKPGQKKDNNADADENSSGVSISKIIPDDRTNQLIIVANHNSFQPIMDLIQKLDIPLTDDEGQIRVYYLKNAVAEDIATTLSSLTQGKTNNNNNKNNKNKKDNKKTTSGGDSAALFEGEVKITADKSTNSLVIVSSARDYKSLKKVLEELDRPRLQVYLETAILEVTVSKNNQFGTGWHSGLPFDKSAGSKDISQGIGFIQSSSNSTMATVTSASGVADLFNIFSGAIGGVLGQMITGTIGGTSVTIPSFGVVLKALQSNSNSKIISTPFLTATDNEEAEVEVGQKIPFQEGYGSTLGNLSGLAGSSASSALSALGGLYSRTDRIDVSLKLNITPHINESGKVRLEFDLSIEDYVGKDESTGQPITATRKIKTTATPNDQETIVLGGLVRDRLRESESKIPLLGNIPILGWLFKTRSWETEKVNLLVIVTPYIVRDESDIRAIAKRKLAEHQRFVDLFYGGKKEYRAFIDYRKKNGMTAILHKEITDEMKRFENGGDGYGQEMLITPSAQYVEPDPNEITEEIHIGTDNASGDTAVQAVSEENPAPTSEEVQ